MHCDWTEWSSPSNPVCTCGPSGADWIKAGQCIHCSAGDVVPEAEVESKAESKAESTTMVTGTPTTTKSKVTNTTTTTESKVESSCGPYGCCPWQQGFGCRTAAGGCNMHCDWTEWSSSSNPVCTCGPSGADWIKAAQCVHCSVEADAVPDAKVQSKVESKVESRCGPYGCCPWQTSGCRTAAGGCNQHCDWTEWSSSSNPVCTCGPSGADWIKKAQCVPCSAEAYLVV